MEQNDNSCLNKDLRQAEKGDYKPAYKKLAKKADFEDNSMSLIGSDGGQEQCNISQNKGKAKPLQLAELGTTKEPMSSDDIDQKTTGPGRIRTYDQWIMSPLL